MRQGSGIWTKKMTAIGLRFSITARNDVEGVAKGTTAGNVLNWEYQLEVEMDGEPLVLTLDDWLYLVDENNMINRTNMYKWGIPVGEITLYIGKK